MSLPVPRPDWALFLDFDGTLVEIADTPDAVAVPDELPELLERLSAAIGGALAIVSGRRIEDIDRLLRNAVTCVAGLHGHERRIADGHVEREDIPEALLRRVHDRLAVFAAEHSGVLLEDKGASVSLHYRQAPQHADACVELTRDLAESSNGLLMLQPGKMVSEVKANGRHKGHAIEDFMLRPPFAGRMPVYVGDDVTDESAFEVVNRIGGASINVGGHVRNSRATYEIADVAGVLHWLDVVVEAIEHKSK